MTPLLHTPEEAAERIRCKRAMIYKLLNAGAIDSVKVGRLRRIPEAALVAYVESLPRTKPAAA